MVAVRAYFHKILKILTREGVEGLGEVGEVEERMGGLLWGPGKG